MDMRPSDDVLSVNDDRDDIDIDLEDYLPGKIGNEVRDDESALHPSAEDGNVDVDKNVEDNMRTSIQDAEVEELELAKIIIHNSIM